MWPANTLNSGVRVTRSLVLCVCFVNRCLSFWPLCCLSFDIYIFIKCRYQQQWCSFIFLEPELWVVFVRLVIEFGVVFVRLVFELWVVFVRLVSINNDFYIFTLFVFISYVHSFTWQDCEKVNMSMWAVWEF